MKQERAKKEIGKRYGRLTVIGEVELEKQIKTVRTMVKCKCDCGNVIDTQLMVLKIGLKQSCGCLHRETVKGNQKQAVKRNKARYQKMREKYIGQKFGKLTILKITSIKPTKKTSFRVRAKVKCDCGKITEKDFYSIIKGATKSCGCLTRGKRTKKE